MLHESEPIQVTTATGNANFFRDDGTGIRKFEFEYKTSGVKVFLHGGSVEDGIQEACEEEIAETRKALMELEFSLVPLLDNRGTDVSIRHRSSDSDDRNWEYNGESVQIAGSTVRGSQKISIESKAADTAVVSAIVKGVVQARETALRKLYRQILLDIQEKA